MDRQQRVQLTMAWRHVLRSAMAIRRIMRITQPAADYILKCYGITPCDLMEEEAYQSQTEQARLAIINLRNLRETGKLTA